jgi:hypothetical protein
MDKFFDLIGFTTPFIYAAATYGLFAWLDENASSGAKIALASFLKLKPVNREVIASAITEAFDRVYTRPLLSWRAFFRSMALTLVVTALFFERRGALAKLDASFAADDITLFAAGIASCRTILRCF